jgi:hypothetical protein
MARLKSNPMMKGATGMVGDTVVFKQWRGRLVVANAPKKREKLSEKQEVTVSRFKDAGSYAKRCMLVPEIKAEYQTGVNYKIHSAYHVALADHMNPPEVVYVDAEKYTGAVDGTITIKAKDDFKVVRVTVTIIDGNGTLIEEGDAEAYFRRLYIWKYKSTAVNSNRAGTVIRVTAYDRPGHKDTMELTL